MDSTLGFCRQVFSGFDSVELITSSVNFFKQENLLENEDINNYFSDGRKVD